MEQLIAIATLDTLGLETYGIVDQNTLFAPPGATFIRVSNGEWKTVVRRLIRRAHSIFLIMPPDQDMREGFAWEIEQIVASGVQSRVIIMLPPCDADVDAHRAALQQACVILALLDDSGRQAELNHFKAYEYECQLSPNTLIVRYKKHAGVTWRGTVPGKKLWQTSSRRERKEKRRKKFVADATYLPGLAEALKATERELSGLSFKARYPPI